MKYSALRIFILLAIVSCGRKINTPVNRKFSDSLLTGHERGMIISCFRCSCIDEFLSTKPNIAALKEIQLLGDSGCVKKRYEHMINFSQAKLDSLWEKNYNILLFKTVNNVKVFSNLKTGDDLTEKAISFFSDN